MSQNKTHKRHIWLHLARCNAWMAAFAIGCSCSVDRPLSKDNNQELHKNTTEGAIVEIAKARVARSESWSAQADFDVNRRGDKWVVKVLQRVGTNECGEGLYAFGSARLIIINNKGEVVDYRHIP